jgi:hypothetical protein
MTPDEEQRVLEMLKDHESDKIVRRRVLLFWTSVGIWAKWLASVGAAVAAIKYLGDTLRGSFK